MQIIPVVDLMAGQVVRARRGDRDSYRPIESRLCSGSDPLTVATALCDYCASDTLYLADLDALRGGAVQGAAIMRLLAARPDIHLWLDAGFADLAAWQQAQASLGPHAPRVTPVFASESLVSADAAARCCAGRDDVILSLDRRGEQTWDRAGCWTTPALWPSRLIVMTLERVGADAGPDLDTLSAISARAAAEGRPIALIGAGGLRHAADAAAAATAGASAWLTASALHDKRIQPAH